MYSNVESSYDIHIHISPYILLPQNAIRVKHNLTQRTEMTCTINRSRFPASMNTLATKSQ